MSEGNCQKATLCHWSPSELGCVKPTVLQKWTCTSLRVQGQRPRFGRLARCYRPIRAKVLPKIALVIVFVSASDHVQHHLIAPHSIRDGKSGLSFSFILTRTAKKSAESNLWLLATKRCRLCSGPKKNNINIFCLYTFWEATQGAAKSLCSKKVYVRNSLCFKAEKALA